MTVYPASSAAIIGNKFCATGLTASVAASGAAAEEIFEATQRVMPSRDGVTFDQEISPAVDWGSALANFALRSARHIQEQSGEKYSSMVVPVVLGWPVDTVIPPIEPILTKLVGAKAARTLSHNPSLTPGQSLLSSLEFVIAGLAQHPVKLWHRYFHGDLSPSKVGTIEDVKRAFKVEETLPIIQENLEKAKQGNAQALAKLHQLAAQQALEHAFRVVPTIEKYRQFNDRLRFVRYGIDFEKIGAPKEWNLVFNYLRECDFRKTFVSHLKRLCNIGEHEVLVVKVPGDKPERPFSDVAATYLAEEVQRLHQKV